MSLFLSRICLNPLYAPAAKLAGNLGALHANLYALLKAQPGAGERPILFRVDFSDEGPAVLLQSTVQPEWDRLDLAPRAFRRPPESKEYAPKFDVGQRLGFRLLARPSIRKSGDFGMKPNGKRKAGPRLDCRDDAERLEWLRWKAGDSGFHIDTVGLTILSFPAIKSNVDPRAKGGSFSAVRFDGDLLVADPDKLKEAVRNGIGPQKAFGFGLLSLAPIGDPR